MADFSIFYVPFVSFCHLGDVYPYQGLPSQTVAYLCENLRNRQEQRQEQREAQR